MITKEEYEKLGAEEKHLVYLERKAAKSMENIREEFYRNIGRVNKLRFEKLAKEHCWEIMKLLYETNERSTERYYKEGIDKADL